MATLRPTTPGNAVKSFIGRPPEPARLWSLGLAALAVLALLATALPSYAARLEPPIQASQAPDVPEATCPAGGQCFADVPSGNSFYEFINRIYMQDLVTGYPCGGPGEPCDAQNRPYYRPGGLVNRQQMAKFIDNARRLPQVRIEAASSTPLIFAFNTALNGIYGASVSGVGVWGDSASSHGVYGHSDSNNGVYGHSNSGKGVYGHSTNNYGVYGYSTNSLAGYFEGDVQVTGICCRAGAGTSRIDHPLDPANRYLSHSLVESPDMKTIYDGLVTLDGKGEAVVSMPEWFDALNRDFRYQLTCVGGYAPVYIAEEIQGNSFKIAGGKAGMKVSWMVTGIRQDPYANAHRLIVEEDKPIEDQGKYLHPTEWGRPESLGVGYEEQP